MTLQRYTRFPHPERFFLFFSPIRCDTPPHLRQILVIPLKDDAVWSFGRLVVWWFSRLGVWSFGGLVVWWFSRLVVWAFGGLGVWWFGRLGV